MNHFQEFRRCKNCSSNLASLANTYILVFVLLENLHLDAPHVPNLPPDLPPPPPPRTCTPPPPPRSPKESSPKSPPSACTARTGGCDWFFHGGVGRGVLGLVTWTVLVLHLSPSTTTTTDENVLFGAVPCVELCESSSPPPPPPPQYVRV